MQLLRTPTARRPLLLALTCWPLPASGQDCDHTVETDVLEVRGPDLGVTAGQTLCVRGGERPFLRFYDIRGSEHAPVTIVNVDGPVVIDNPDRGYGLTFDGSAHFHITGTGTSDPYGFSVRATRTGPDYSASCVSIGGLSTDYELDHFEIMDCGFAGLNLKTEPRCDGSANLGAFVQKNTSIHDNFIHDTHGEGIYFGSTGYGGRDYDCDGVTTTLFPHTHEGVYLYRNLITDTGWDGLQVGVSPKDCYVYRNTILRVGLAGEEYQMQGIQIGGASRCTVSENFLAHGPAIGIIALDNQDTTIENNLVFDFETGIYVNDRDNPESEGARYLVLHNTVVSALDRGIALFGNRSNRDLVLNNLVVDTVAPLTVSQEVDADQLGNLTFDSIAAAGFKDAAAEDFDLAADSPARDTGESGDVSVEGDLLGRARDDLPDVGAYEFGGEALGGAAGAPPGRPPGGASSSGGSPSSGVASQGAAETTHGAGGCAIATAGRSAHGRNWISVLLTLLFVGIRLSRTRKIADD